MPDRSKPSPRLSPFTRQTLPSFPNLELEARRNIPFLTRLTAHLAIFALVIVALLLSGLEIEAGPLLEASQGAEGDLPPIQIEGEGNPGDLRIVAVPFTGVGRLAELAEPAKPARHEIVQYVVQPNDTVSRIASKFHVTPDSILWANQKLQDNPDMLTVGQTLDIPPTTGVLYVVQRGDTLQGIASQFSANVDDIVNDPFNQADHNLKANPPLLVAGKALMVPGGKKAFVQKSANVATGTAPAGVIKGTSTFIKPTTACLTQSFAAWHSGVDLANAQGTAVVAADSGYVSLVATGWNTGYGNEILIDHGNGYITRYAHLSAFAVRQGQSVKKGQLIGRMGTTGNSTGPHLHFEIIYKGAFRNPAYFIGPLPRRCPGY